LLSEMTKSRGPYDGIVCHSFGGVAALNSVRQGASCEKLVLISPGVYEIKPMFKTFVGLFGLDEEYYAERLFGLAESLYGTNPGDFGLERFSKQIETETLIIHCEDDKEALKEIAITLHGELKHSTLHLTEGLGHRRILRDEKVAKMVLDFLLAFSMIEFIKFGFKRKFHALHINAVVSFSSRKLVDSFVRQTADDSIGW